VNDGAAVIADLCAAVRRLASAASSAGVRSIADAARKIANEVERVGMAPPFSMALVGDAAERARFLARLAGDELIAPARRMPDAMTLTVRRGPVTLVRARHRDGHVEEIRAGEGIVRDVTPAPELVPAPDLIEAPPPAPARVPWWALWRRIKRWLARRKQLPPAPPALPAPALPAPPAKPKANDPFVAAVRALTDADARGATVERLFLELAHGPLAEDVVILELPAGGTRVFEQANVDGALLLGARDAAAQSATAVLRSLFTLEALGGLDGAIDSLGRTLRLARVKRLVDRGLDVLDRGAEEIDGVIERAEADFAARIAKLEAQQITDPQAFEDKQIARVMPQILERVHTLIAQATDEHGRELERIAADWSARVAAASSTDALRTAVAALDVDAPAQLAAARAHAVRFVVGGLAGAAHDVHPALMSILPARERVRPPSARPIELAGFDSGLELGDVAPRFRSLVRSTDRLKQEASAKLAERVTLLRQRAGAALLDAEPMLVAAIADPLRATFRAELDRHVAWLAGELAREHDAVDRERAALAPIARARDDARADAAAILARLD